MTDKYTLGATITIDGRELERTIKPFIEQIVIDDHLQLPDTFTLTLLDPQRRILERCGVRIGATVEISSTPIGGAQAISMIKADVTAIEGDYDTLGARAVIRGYDLSHRLHRGKQTRTYCNVTDTDIARQVAQRVGIPLGQVDESDTVHDYVAQSNLSDWDFLQARATEVGFEMSVLDGKFNFRRPPNADGAPAEGNLRSERPDQLVYGGSLLQFHPRVSAAEQVTRVDVRGWDPGAKKELVGSAPAATTSVLLADKPGDLASRFGSPVFTAVDRTLATASAVDAAAKAIAETIGSAFAEADGVAIGDPRLKAGTPVSVAGVAQSFNGGYTLSRTRHVFDGDGYRTHFEVTGRQERSLLGLASLGASNSKSSPGSATKMYGLVIGIVTANDDPRKLGRVMVKFPWMDDRLETNWARVTQFGAGPDSGAVFLPEVNDEVLVGFGHGDPNQPFVIGGLYNGVDKPYMQDGLLDNGRVKRRYFVSRMGHSLTFFDHESETGIEIQTKDGSLSICLDDKSQEITIRSQGKVNVESSGDMTLKSAGKLAIEGSGGVEISSPGAVTVSGQPIKLN